MVARSSLKCILLLFLLSPRVYAAELLTWQACLQEAFKNNANLQYAQKTYDSYRYASYGAYSNFFPQLNGTLGYNYSAYVPPVTPNYQGTLSLTQNLFNGFQDQGGVLQAMAQKKAYQAALDQAKAQMFSDLKNAYGSLLIAQRQVALQEGIRKRRVKNLTLIELQFKSGIAEKGSVLLYRAYLKQVQYALLQAKDNITVSQAKLALALGRDQPGEYEVAEEVPLEKLPPAVDFAELVLQTPNYQQSVSLEQAAAAGVVIAQSSFFPSLNLNASMSQFGQEFFPHNNSWLVGVNLTLPFFKGGQNYYQTKSAIEVSHAATSTRKSLNQQLMANCKQAYLTYLEAMSQLDMNESFQEAGIKRSETATVQYNNGLITFIDWDLLESARITYETNYIQSQQNLISAEAAWMLAQGKSG